MHPKLQLDFLIILVQNQFFEIFFWKKVVFDIENIFYEKIDILNLIWLQLKNKWLSKNKFQTRQWMTNWHEQRKD